MLGGYYHVSRAVQGVGARRENAQFFALCGGIRYFKVYFRALGTAYPVGLQALCGIGPVEPIEAFDKLVGVCRNPQNPLAELSALDGEFADFALAVYDFFVGEHRAEGGAPPDGLFVNVGKPPLEEAQEYPLCPFEIRGVGGIHFPLPVYREAYGLYLFSEIADIGGGSDARVRSGFYRVLFRRQSEGVPPHRMQDVEAVGPLVARDYVGGGVALGVAYVQTRAGGVGEHVQNIVFPISGRGGSHGVERFVFVPFFLPALLDFSKIVLGVFVCHDFQM